MKPKVYVTCNAFPDIIQTLAESFDLRVWGSPGPVPRDVFLEEAGVAEGIFTLLTDRVDRELLDASPRLRVVANMAVGYDNIDVAECTRRGILVTNTPGVLTETTADLALALMLAAARRLGEAERFLRSGQWTTWDPALLLGRDVHGASLGIVGLGRIGQAVARRAVGFDMEVLYFNRTPRPEAERQLGVTRAGLDELLGRSDFISLHLPLSASTQGFIGERELGLMKPEAILVNTSRGALIDEDALCRALRENRLFCAGLDVYREEPLPKDSPLLALENAVLLPHVGSATLRTRRLMAQMATTCLKAAMTGGDCPNLVNPEALEVRRGSV